MVLTCTWTCKTMDCSGLDLLACLMGMAYQGFLQPELSFDRSCSTGHSLAMGRTASIRTAHSDLDVAAWAYSEYLLRDVSPD